MPGDCRECIWCLEKQVQYLEAVEPLRVRLYGRNVQLLRYSSQHAP